jgi:DHA1 family inner membrane transport protein
LPRSFFEGKKVVRQNGILAEAFALSIVGAAFFNILPLYLGAAQDHFALSIAQTGYIGSTFFVGYTLATCLAYFWMPHIDWRKMTVFTLALGSLAMLFTSLASSYNVLLLAIFIAGGSYATLYGVGTAMIGGLANETRNFGWKIALEAIIRWRLIGVSADFDFAAFRVCRAGYRITRHWCSRTAVLPFMPSQAAEKTHLLSAPQSAGDASVWLLLIALVLFFSGETIAWSFVERVGDHHGYDAANIGTVLAVSLGFAVAGSLTEAYGAARIGHVLSLLIAGLTFFLALLCFANLSASTFTLFAVGACLANFSIGFGLPSLVAICAHYDVTGKLVVLTVPAIGIGAVLGPALAGLAAQSGGFIAMLVIGRGDCRRSRRSGNFCYSTK